MRTTRRLHIASMVLLAGTVLSLVPYAMGQKTVAPGRAPALSATGIPDADSLRRYGTLLDKGDSLTLARVLNPGGSGQMPPRTAQLYVLAHAEGDSIVLRWAPSTPGGWLAGNKAGYIVTRGVIMQNGTVDKSSLTKLTAAPLAPWKMDDWGKRADHANRWAAVAAGALHAKAFVPEIQQRSETGQIKAASDELLARFAYATLAADNDPVAADGLALRYVDRTATKGMRYVYSVRPAAKDTSYAVLEGVTAASPGVFLPDPPPPGLEAEPQDRLVLLRWQDGVLGARYGGFYISRSEDGGKTFVRLNQHLFIPGGQAADDPHIMYPDSNVVNYHRYVYRVQGVTPFGGLSEPAEADAVPRDMTPPPAPIAHRPEDLGRRGMRIVWEMPVLSGDLHGFVVLRSAFWQTGYHPAQEKVAGRTSPTDTEILPTAITKYLLAPGIREYTDSLSSGSEPYYMVISVDTAGNIGRSLPVYSERIDTIPPGVPTGIHGTIDTLGIVRLHWRPGPEPNLLGYRVYWSNSATDTFAVRVAAPIPDTTFTDTVEINTLTRHVFYKVTAVNTRYIPSAFSPVITLTRPDMVPPASPQIVALLVSDSSVTLTWAISPSSDVRSHIVHRRTLPDTVWKQARVLGRTDSVLIEKDLPVNRMYEYAVEAVDSSGLHSPMSSSVVARPYDTGVRPPVNDLKAAYRKERGTIDLTWTYTPSRKEHVWFEIYRESPGSGLVSRKAVEGSVRSFMDDLNGVTGHYRYAIKVRTDAGGEPPLSKPVEVDVR